MDLLKKKVKKLEQEIVGQVKTAVTDLLQESKPQQQQQQQQQQQHYPPPAVLNSPGHLAPMASPGAGGFVHPGTLMGPNEVSLLRQRAVRAVSVDDTWLAAQKALLADTPLTYTPHALPDVLIEWGDGPKRGHDQLVEKDGKIVYMQVLAWLLTNDGRYAESASAIIDAWSSVNKSFAGKNAPLNAGWGVASLARSAELLKHTWPGWSPAVEARFVAWVNKLILPALNHEMLERLPQANWHTTIAECKAQLALLTGNRALWDDALRMWYRVFDAYIRPCGECHETQRDIFHSQFGLGGLIQLAEMAWQQGINLYSYQNSRLFTMMEFHAFINNGGKPQECCYELKGVGFLPCGWEVGYNHYTQRMGWQMPQTSQMLSANRPEKYVFHWGLGTLTHYRTGEVLFRRAVLPAPA